MKPYVYLAGPVSGLSYDEANDWRVKVTRVLLPDIICLNPLRGKEHLASKTSPIMPSPMDGFCTDQAIVMRDYNDVLRSAAVLVHLVPPSHSSSLGSDHISIGTLFELAWAFRLRKIVVATGVDADTAYNHPFVRQAVTYFAADLPDAVDFMKTVLIP